MKKFVLALSFCLLGWTTASAAPAEDLVWNVEYPQEACSEIVGHSLERGIHRPVGLSILCRDAAGKHTAFATNDIPKSGWIGRKVVDIERMNFIPSDVSTLRIRWAE
jgi:hypothetical protein